MESLENDKTVYPPLPQTLEIAPRFPHSLRPAADNLYPIFKPKKEPSSTAYSPHLQAHSSIGKD